MTSKSPNALQVPWAKWSGFYGLIFFYSIRESFVRRWRSALLASPQTFLFLGLFCAVALGALETVIGFERHCCPRLLPLGVSARVKARQISFSSYRITAHAHSPMIIVTPPREK